MFTIAIAALLSAHAPHPVEANPADDAPRTVLCGTIIDGSGRPVPGVTVQLYNGIATRWPGQKTVTDVQGRYRFDPLETGQHFFDHLVPGLTIEHDRLVSGDGETWWDIEIPVGATVEHDLVLRPGGIVKGRLTYGGGEWRLDEAEIRIISEDRQRVAYANTGRSGEFTTGPLFPGRYIVEWNKGLVDNPVITTVVVGAGAVTTFDANLRFTVTATITARTGPDPLPPPDPAPPAPVSAPPPGPSDPTEGRTPASSPEPAAPPPAAPVPARGP